jgi:hypothetical protein
MSQNNDINKADKKRSKLPLAGLIGAAAIGAVYLYGKNKERVQHKLRGWMLKVKGEVMEQAAEVEELTREKYEGIVDAAIDKYKDKKAIAAEEFEQARQQLKAQWSEIHEKVEKHAESVEETGSDTIRSAISAAIAGAADEVVKKHDADMSTMDLIKKAFRSGADNAKNEVADMITTNPERDDGEDTPTN